jgi:hypothetical protein
LESSRRPRFSRAGRRGDLRGCSPRGLNDNISGSSSGQEVATRAGSPSRRRR